MFVIDIRDKIEYNTFKANKFCILCAAICGEVGRSGSTVARYIKMKGTPQIVKHTYGGRSGKEGETQMNNEEIMKVVKPAICAQLKSPASAQFPVDMISIVGDEIRGYHVAGYVDSQNSYGAMIRNDFTADVAIENGFPVVKSSSVAVKASKERAKAFGINYVAITVFTIIMGAILYFIISMMVGL